MSKLDRVCSWLVALLVPLAVIGLALRAVLVPPYLQIEYRMPYFPRDDYGFSTQDRIHWATFASRYLVNSSNISFLGDLTFADGAPLFNGRELSHMQDVKRVVQHALLAWYAALALLAGVWVWSWRTRRLAVVRLGARRGGWFIVGLALAIGSIVVVGVAMNPDVFWQFFAAFHGLFFKGDSWLFAYSDTLIRLFPIRFWQDTFLAAGLIVLIGGLGLELGLRQDGGTMHDV